MHSGALVSSGGGNSTCLSSEFACVWLAGEQRAGEGVSACATADVKDFPTFILSKLSTQVRKVQIICHQALL